MLIIEGISSSYDQVRVLSGVSLNVKEGEVLAYWAETEPANQLF